MKEFTYSKENAKRISRSQAISRIPLMLIAIFAGLYAANYRTDGQVFSTPLVLYLSLSFGVIGIAIGVLIGINSAIKRLMQNVYRITDVGIERLTPSGETVSMDFANIDLHKLSNKGLLLKGQNKKIIIPSELDNYDEISNSILERIK